MRPAGRVPRAGGWRRWLVVGGIVLLPAISRSALAQRVDYSGSFQSTGGEYVFDQVTVSHSLLSGVTVSGARWRFGASIPLIIQNSGALSYVGGQPVPTGGPNSGIFRDREPGERIPMRRGAGGGAGARILGTFPSLIDTAAAPLAPGPYETTVGDPVLNAGLDLYRSGDGSNRLAGQVFAKLPVASVASGVGTGAVDYGAGLTLSLASGPTFGFVDASYWAIGDMPDLPLRDIVSGAVGIGRSIGPAARWSLMGIVSGGTSVVANVEGPLAAGLGIGYLVSERRSLTGGVSLGFSESSPDWSAYVGWRAGISR